MMHVRVRPWSPHPVPSTSRQRPLRRPALLAVFLLLAAPRAAHGQMPSPGEPASDAARAAEAAFLFAYRSPPDARAPFDEGYRAHLAWHRAKGDPFAWYGWDVVRGADAGVFVDGTFGPSLADFEQRVAPDEDAAHFTEHVAPYGERLWSETYRVRRDLGTSRTLEARAPTPFLHVLRYELQPGAAARFEALLAGMVRAADSGARREWAVYELLESERPVYLVLVPVRGEAVPAVPDPFGFFVEASGGAARRRAQAAVTRTVASATGAVWQLREDLTLIP